MGYEDARFRINIYKMEGLVGRPCVELKDRCGNRVIVKIKWEDFKHLSEVE